MRQSAADTLITYRASRTSLTLYGRNLVSTRSVVVHSKHIFYHMRMIGNRHETEQICVEAFRSAPCAIIFEHLDTGIATRSWFVECEFRAQEIVIPQT